MANSVGQIQLDLVVNPSKFKQQMNGINKTAKSSTNALTGMFGKVAKAAAVAFSVAKIVSFSKSCLQLGSDLAEVQNVVDVTFGSMSDAVNNWAKNAMTSYGMSEKVAKEYMGQFGAMSKAFGNTEQMAYDQAAALTGLVGDVASFYNMTTEEAFTKLKAVYTGETEAIRSLGVVMTQAALDEYALAKGYGKTTSAMTEQEKVALRLAFVTDRLSDASGDFVRTADGWANQTRVLQLRFESLKATIGQGLINALLPVVRLLNTILERLQVVADAFSNFMAGIFGDAGPATSAVSSAVSGTGAIASNLGDAESSAKSIKKSLAGFDQINVLSNKGGSSSGSSGGDVAVGGAASAGATIGAGVEAAKKALQWVESLPKLSFDVDWATVGANIKTGFANLWASIKDWTTCYLTISINVLNDLKVDNLIEKLSALWVSFTNLAATISDVLSPAIVNFYNIALSPLVQWIGEKLSDAITTVKALFDSWAQWFADNNEAINSFIGLIAGVVAGVWSIMEPLGNAIWNTFKDILIKLSDAFQSVFQFILNNQGAIVTALTIIGGAWAMWTISGLIADIGAFIVNGPGLIATLGTLATSIWTTVSAKVADRVETLALVGLYAKDFVKSLVSTIGSKAKELAAWVASTAAKVADKAATIASTVATNAQAAAQWALNAAMNANPIGLVVAAVVALTAAFAVLWSKSEGFRNFFINMWEGIKKGVGGVINGIIGIYEGFVNGLINGLNFLIRGINKISFKVPDWVPLIGGKQVGFNLKEVAKISIPKLATGGYVEANTPQLAIIGDNKREGEIVAPESKITEAVVAAFRQFIPLFNNNGNNKPIYLTLKLGDGTFWEGFVDYHNDIVKRTGDTPLLV